MARGYTQQNDAVSITTPLGADALLLRGFSGQEAISDCFDLDLSLCSEDPALDFAAILGQGATITIKGADGSPRYLHGIVTEFRQGASDPEVTDYRAKLRPRLWLLSLTSDCRIFQNLKAPDIIQAVLAEQGVNDVRLALSRSYDTREYCVQYNESALAFVSRLMEEEGICYFFEHSANTHTLVLSDDAGNHPDCPLNAEARYLAEGLRGVGDEDTVSDCQITHQVTSQRYVTRDYNFETPDTSLEVSTQHQETKPEVYRYPDGYTLKGAGEARAGLRLDDLVAEGQRWLGESLCRGFVSGHCFTLRDHPREDANARLKLLRLSHHCERGVYRNSFEAIPADTDYRPPQRTPRPRISGGQTARVVGPSDETDIWTDEHGRIKVQFHWDREGKKDDQSSCWMRVSQPTAGNGWGTVFLPRIGQEVVVTFLEGDPDRPLVTGTVYNGTHATPYGLPADRTRSTFRTQTFGGDGFNELAFDDKAGEEEIFVHAEHDMNIEIKNDRNKTVGANETNVIKDHRTTTIEQGNETLTVTEGDRTIKVETGKEVHEVKGTRALTVTGDETHTNDANFEHNVAGNHTLTVSGDLTIDVAGSITITAGQGITLKAGTSIESSAGTTLTSKAGGSLTNEAGGSLTNKAGGSMTNQAGGSLTAQAGGSLTNQASGSVTVQGSMVTVSGGMVKLG